MKKEEEMEKAKTICVVVLCLIALFLLATPTTLTFLYLLDMVVITPEKAMLIGFLLWMVGGVGCTLALRRVYETIFPKTYKADEA
ncbi:MAG: hypothetical protein Q8Q46_03040 [Candidatus Giovannonibacteria bacterium]|nr:hypothetical protein [Candidatus Giovannonibacteria bacterium]